VAITFIKSVSVATRRHIAVVYTPIVWALDLCVPSESGTHGAGDALADSALLVRGEMDAVAQVSNTFFAAAPGASSVGVSTNSMAMSAIGEAVSDVPDSLNLSSSFSRSVGEVECEAFLARGRRCCEDLTICDCGAYAASSLLAVFQRTSCRARIRRENT
jgi:hypothetical protein